MMHSDDLNAYNSFDQANLLHPTAFSPVLEGGKLTVELPSLSVSTVTVEAQVQPQIGDICC
jgi:alpha-L-arabinofuranosidase